MFLFSDTCRVFKIYRIRLNFVFCWIEVFRRFYVFLKGFAPRFWNIVIENRHAKLLYGKLKPPCFIQTMKESSRCCSWTFTVRSIGFFLNSVLFDINRIYIQSIWYIALFFLLISLSSYFWLFIFLYGLSKWNLSLFKVSTTTIDNSNNDLVFLVFRAKDCEKLKP